MRLTDHLRELRNRLLVCLGALVVCLVLGIGYAGDAVRFLLAIGERYGYQFVYLSPQELLLEYFSVDLVGSLCVALPVLAYEAWAFLRPGLRRNERLAFLGTLLSGFLFACLGVAFAYRILIPFTLAFLASVGDGSGVRSAVSVQNYVSFLLTLFLVFAAVFELPVVAVLLTQLNIVKIQWMRRFRKAVVVLIFFVAALITPPDVVSQVLVAVPLLLLYELSILLCVLVARIRKPGGEETD